jgi:hypothetical protein
MEKHELKASLAELHGELSQVENVDPTTREMLVTIMQDIVKVLQSDQAGAELQPATESPDAEDEAAPPHGSDSLRNMVIEFEAEHPKLARTIGQIADGLASLGI